MKVLLTGASGFVGSHILESLRSQGADAALFLRKTAATEFVKDHLPNVEIRHGSLDDAASLEAAMDGITHVIHCAGATKALTPQGFFDVNHLGTKNIVSAVNARRAQIQRLVHISSLAAAGPAVAQQPATESDAPRPVSVYGRSKLAGEREVMENCRSEFVVLRPPAVYGPRDAEFLRLFKAVKSHLLPAFGGGRQPLSFVFVKDLADAAVHALTHPSAHGECFFVAAEEIATARQLAAEIAAQMNVWTLPLPLPNFILWPVCAIQEIISRLTGKANVLSRQKYAELAAPGWVCSAHKLKRQTGYQCRTSLREGIAATLAWYRQNRWL
jgi:nucleoside-diphosphate-sugar epimerase